MEVKSQKVNTFFFFILLASHISLGAPTTTWVGSKYQIECTMCTACDNPCNQQPPPSPQIFPPPPPSTGGGGYYYSPPPPSTAGGGGGYYYSPPPPSQSGYYYPPAAVGNYPNNLGPPNPITNYFPYYYHNSPQWPQYASASGVSVSGMFLLINVLLLLFKFMD